MHAIFSRRVVVVVGSFSSQLTKSLLKKKPAFSQPSQSRHFLQRHLLPSGLASSSSSSVTRFVPSLLSRSDGFFASTLRNIHLKLKSGNPLEPRVGFFSPQLPSNRLEPWVFTGFQKRGWKSWVNGANAVVYGLIIANAAVFTMWKVSDKQWMAQNFMLSLYNLRTGSIHTLITSGFSNVEISQIIMNMTGLYYFGTSIARTLGPLYLLKLYFAGSLAGSVLFLSGHALMAILESQGLADKDQLKLVGLVGAEASVIAITLLDIFLYPQVTTYFELMSRVPVMIAILALVNDMLKVLEGEKSITATLIQAGAGAMVAATAWRQIRKGRFYY